MTSLTPAIIEETVLDTLIQYGDVEKMTPQQRTDFYRGMCVQLDLNPLSKPFELLKLNGRTQLYATRNATDQLRAKRDISISITARDRHEDVYVVTVEATRPAPHHPDGVVTDSSIGAVPIAGLKGEALANAQMKAETKAKRRVTLSITGLSLMDETEAVTIPDASFAELDVATGEITNVAPPLPQPAPQPAAAPKQNSERPADFQIYTPEGRELSFRIGTYSWGMLAGSDIVWPKDYMPSFLNTYFGIDLEDKNSQFAWMRENLAPYGYAPPEKTGWSDVAPPSDLGRQIIEGFFELVAQGYEWAQV